MVRRAEDGVREREGASTTRARAVTADQGHPQPPMRLSGDVRLRVACAEHAPLSGSRDLHLTLHKGCTFFDVVRLVCTALEPPPSAFSFDPVLYRVDRHGWSSEISADGVQCVESRIDIGDLRDEDLVEVRRNRALSDAQNQ